MKSTHTFKESGEKLIVIKVGFNITATNIEQSITEMLDLKYAVNKSSVKQNIMRKLSSNGTTWFEYGFYEEYAEPTDKAIELSKKLFPSFY